MGKVRILCAAIRHEKTGLVFSMPRPARHRDIITLMVESGAADLVDRREEGFMASDGRFLSRADALTVAVIAGQAPYCACGTLSSDMLW